MKTPDSIPPLGSNQGRSAKPSLADLQEAIDRDLALLGGVAAQIDAESAARFDRTYRIGPRRNTPAA